MVSSNTSLLDRLRQHPSAPRWNHQATDRLLEDDLARLAQFSEALRRGQHPTWEATPPAAMLDWLETQQRLGARLRHLPRHLRAFRSDWGGVATMSRETIATAAAEVVPDDADLERLIVYRTAGTTGHPLWVPHHPRSAAAYQPLISAALAAAGVSLDLSPEHVACFLVGSQKHTVTYPTTLSAWKGAGFAKLNLNPGDWPSHDAANHYFGDMAPQLLTGDPLSFCELSRAGVHYKPKAMLATAVALSDGVRAALSARHDCPVIDWYSLTETGPIGYKLPDADCYRVLPHDLYVEVVDQQGRPLPDGQRGEITVTGGRNPFLPLVRYRTGDWAHIQRDATGVYLHQLEGRQPVRYKNAAGEPVNAVDLSRVIRRHPILQYRFSQSQDLSCELVYRPLVDAKVGEVDLASQLAELLGELALSVTRDDRLGQDKRGKFIPYHSELPLEE